MTQIRMFLEALQKGNLLEAEKCLFTEMNNRKEEIINNGRDFVAQSIKA